MKRSLNYHKIALVTQISRKIRKFDMTTKTFRALWYAAAAFPRPCGYEKSFGRTFNSLLVRLTTYTRRQNLATTTYSETNV